MFKFTGLALVTLAMLGSITLAGAQTPPGRDVHHPDIPATVPMMDMGKMMGGGDMGQMMSGMPMHMHGAMMPFDHIEGRIAFQKAELGITDAQLPQWNAFADALREGAKTMRTAMTAATQAGMPTTAPARADVMIQMMSTRLDVMKSIATSGKALYAVLTDAQKKTVDEMMMPCMGMEGRGCSER